MAAVAEPTGQFAADRAARGLVGPTDLTRDDQHDAHAARHRSVERTGQRDMRTAQMMAVEINRHVRGQLPGPQFALPCLVEAVR